MGGLLLGCAVHGLGAAPGIAGTAEVIDGDSLRLQGVELRLWGIDAPEYRQTCWRGSRRWSCGKAAARALRQRLRGHSLECVVLTRDRHGRAVVRCEIEGRSINAWMVEHGWALDYRRYSQGHYQAEQDSARSSRRGLWSSQFQHPEAWRRAHPR